MIYHDALTPSTACGVHSSGNIKWFIMTLQVPQQVIQWAVSWYFQVGYHDTLGPTAGHTMSCVVVLASELSWRLKPHDRACGIQSSGIFKWFLMTLWAPWHGAYKWAVTWYYYVSSWRFKFLISIMAYNHQVVLRPFQAWIYHCHLHPLQAANCCRNSRLVVDENVLKWVKN